jgi:phosphohistidine swiveling domain-containing protein
MSGSIVAELGRATRKEASGQKAANLLVLARAGQRIPTTYVCSADVCRSCGDGDTRQKLLKALARVIRPDRTYAVRSSANVEDRRGSSYAGQFRTLLGVRGPDAVLDAILTVCGSTDAAEIEGYLARAGHSRSDVEMSVIVQDMVEPVVSGVAFSRNPMTGFDETIIEAVRGSGEALVQGGATPERWVWKWGAWQAAPAEPALPEPVAAEVARATRSIARAYGKPADLEWVWNGRDVYWVQLREITTLDDINVYSNSISREMLPGQVKPLVWSINIPLVNTAWVRFFSELIGPNDIDPRSLARAFHYRVYFNMGVIGRIFDSLGMPPESLELMMGVQAEGPEKPRMMPSHKALRHGFRMLGFALDKYRFARKTERFLPRTRAWYDEFRKTDLAGLDDDAILSLVDRLYEYTLATAYHNVVTPLLMLFYSRLLRSRLERLGRDFAELDLTRGLDGFAEVDPKAHMARLREQLDRFEPGPGRPKNVADLAAAGKEDFRQSFDEFLGRFGHLSDSGVDFSYVPWRERPDDVLEMIRGFAPRPAGKGRTLEELGLPSRDRARLRWLYRRARQFRLLRERTSSLYTYGYGLFRPLFIELGRRWSDHGRLAAADDIFYLYLEEVRALARGERLDARRLAARRRAEMVACADARLPSLIFGDTPPPLEETGTSRLSGVATSRGYYRGPVRIIRSTAESSRLQAGDVLVIPFSDVGWTPLFARAGAVIAESGGILSHSSIVAREYNIPAVVSVPGALGLPDGAEVTVDGFTGEISIHQSPKEA